MSTAGSDFALSGLYCVTMHVSGCIGSPLGMEHGHIPDRDITASSTFDYHSVGPHMGRARQDAKGGAWCPAQAISHGVEEWIEINLHRDYRITAVETMGRFGGGQGQEFAETYQIEYWRAGIGKCCSLAIYPLHMYFYSALCQEPGTDTQTQVAIMC